MSERANCNGTVAIGYFVFLLINLYIESIDF